ncbi:WD40 repeat-containing protein [Cavenderia fasciculata]|uniref:WD40 repeat-containing protein n=1 Tax=Cavenderia fasciculata TaxID=261658 RepID=F4PGZ7_CACFS|nr:WD40 repeat-containing protein [Cavenderia fasciculata]EGG24981.1 WD40 repeat-containing protein [Cavenderia fasciculata]|eukprot:XP_004362832.1 WD40 repeat-containing protein [Cavenderia fasciculata]
MAERMLKFGICSNVRVLNTQSTSYHPIASSSVNRIEQSEIGAGSGITSTTATTLIMMNGGGSDSILSGASSASASSAAASLVDSSLSSIGSSSSGISLQFHSLNSSTLTSGSNSSSSGTGNNTSVGGSSVTGTSGNSVASGGNGADQSHYTFPNAPIFSSVCFHPTSPILYVSIRNEIYFYDLLNQSIKGKLMIDNRETIQSIVTLNYSGNGLQKFLLCFTQEGLLYLWDTDTHKLITIVHPIKQFDTRSITCKSSAPNKATVYYSKANSKDIVVEDFEKGSMTSKLKGHKKPISSLTHHPTKSYLASVSIDGSLKIWDTKSQIALLNLEDFTSYENSRNIEHSSNFFLAFECATGKYMVMTGSSGLTLVYGDLTSNSQEIIAVGFICKGNTILSLVHHPQLPVFFIVSINHQTGVEELSAWEINYQMKSIVPSSLLSATPSRRRHYSATGSVSQQGDGIDATMIGSTHILILGLDGRIAKVAQLSTQGVSAFKNFQLTPKVASVFKTPLQDGRVVQYYSQEKNCILYSKNINPTEKDNYAVDTQIQLYLFKNEKVYKIEWQTDIQKNQNICSIMTDMRIIITNAKMEVINQTQVPPSHRNSSCYFTSIYWLEWTLLYTTPTHLMYMTLQNNLLPRPISSLSIAPIVLSVVFPDRIIYAYQGVGIGSSNARVAMSSSISNSSSSSQSGLLSSSTDSSSGVLNMASSASHSNNVNNSNYINNQTVVHALSVGLLECLAVGLLSLPSWLAPADKKQTSLYLQNLVSRFEYTRTSRFLLDKLRERGFVDLTYSLANNMRTSHSKLSSLDKFRLAWSSKQYQDAHRHLIEEYNRQLTSAKLVSSANNTTEQPLTNGASLNGHSNGSAGNGPQTLDKRSFGRLKELMRDFARECVNAGYYNLAKDCFARLGEHVYLLQIAVILGDREAVQQIRKDAETRSDAVLVGACDKFLSAKKKGGDSSLSSSSNSMTENGKLNPPVIKILPWAPTDHIHLGIKAGNDYMSPVNLNNINRYFPVTGVFNSTASSYGSQRHKLRTPDETWPPQDYKHSVALTPPRTLNSLVSHKLSTKAHISSTHTLRRSPSSENITMSTSSAVRFNTSNVQIGADNDYDSDSDSGADADVDSDNDDDLNHISKSLEDHMKGLTTTTSDSQSMGDYEDDDSRSSTIDSSTPPLSSTPTAESI